MDSHEFQDPPESAFSLSPLTILQVAIWVRFRSTKWDYLKHYSKPKRDPDSPLE
jgi:hypothetical protein